MHFLDNELLEYTDTMPSVVSITVNISMDTDNKISSFASLPEGWDYGNGGPIPASTLALAFEWNGYLRSLGFFETGAFPGGDGEVVLATGYGDHYLEVIIEPKSKISVAYDYKGKQKLYLPNMAATEAKWAISNIVGQIWSASDYFIPTNLINVPTSSPDQHSVIRRQTGSYRLLEWNVLNSPARPSALTSANTSWESPESLEIHPFFGSLTRPHSRRVMR
jgi:hypothetical protein